MSQKTYNFAAIEKATGVPRHTVNDWLAQRFVRSSQVIQTKEGSRRPFFRENVQEIGMLAEMRGLGLALETAKVVINRRCIFETGSGGGWVDEEVGQNFKRLPEIASPDEVDAFWLIHLEPNLSRARVARPTVVSVRPAVDNATLADAVRDSADGAVATLIFPVSQVIHRIDRALAEWAAEREEKNR